MIRPDWPAMPGVHAAVTTRQGGVSSAPFASFNLATHVGDEPQAVQENRRRLVATLGLPQTPRWLEQEHGRRVIDAGDPQSAICADASIARRPGVVCAVLTADCLPVLFCDRRGERVAAAHAGWRGLADGVLEATVAALDCSPQNLLAWLGPAIGPRRFEVGGEVREAFVAEQPQAAVAFTPSTNGRWLADLYRLARLRLAAVGVDAVYGGGLCTYDEPQRFYSYRRDRTTGRMASLIWIA